MFGKHYSIIHIIHIEGTFVVRTIHTTNAHVLKEFLI